MLKKKVIIIGGGLTGLATAFFLKQKGIDATIIEARTRLGGRIYTLKEAGKVPIDLGATWLGKKHDQLIGLLDVLGIDIFEQFQGEQAIYEAISTSPPQLVTLPPNPEPSFRIKGGSSTLIETLAKKLDIDQIKLGERVTHVEYVKNEFQLKTDHAVYRSHILISTLPPFLLTESISFSPNLPDELLKIARQTHTWMGASIKVALTFAKPFWKDQQTSGTIFSNVGPINEMYDHSNFESSYFALKGFLNSAFFISSKAERLEVVLKQLSKYFGNKVKDYLSYEEYVWRKDKFTFLDYHQPILPHQNNGHSIFQKPYFNNQLYIAGSETASAYPGYMDGAVRSATFVSENVIQQLSQSK